MKNVLLLIAKVILMSLEVTAAALAIDATKNLWIRDDCTDNFS